MVVGLLTLDLHIPRARSLKDKRQVLRRLTSRVRSRFNVAIAEVGDHDLWQRASLAAVSLNTDRDRLDATLESVANEVEKERDLELLSFETEFL